MKDPAFAPLFDDPAAWQVFASGQAEGVLSRIDGPGGNGGMRLDYDFHGGGGFVVIRRVIALRLPDTFEMGFRLRGSGPHNHFEVKVASPGGANVWRHLRQDFAMPPDWEDFRFHEREFPFAWGPAGGGGPSDVEALEIVVAAGPGGKGTIELAHAYLEDQTLRAPRNIRASSHQPGHGPEAAFSPEPVEWRALPGDADPFWEMDFGRGLRFGGLVIEWPDDLPARKYELEVSDDGKSWRSLYRASHALGRLSHISTQGAEARFLRLKFGDAGCAGLRGISLKPDAFSSTPNEFIHSVAADYPRGWHPRYWHREQSYWTPVGSPAGKRRALVNEEGMVEVDEAGFALEPFVLTDHGLLTWADVKTSVAAEKGGVPMPCVTWKSKGVKLGIFPWVDGEGDGMTLRVTYRLQATRPHSGMRFVVAVRPFQVNPPWQAFRNLGGRSPIGTIERKDDALRVNDRLVFCSPQPASMGAAMFEEGGVTGFLAKGSMPPDCGVVDPVGLGSAAMQWDLPAGAKSLEVTVSVPYYGKRIAAALSGRAKALAVWKRTLGRVKWRVPACAQPAFDCLRGTAGHILINRDGPAIQPGPRRYTRSWVRDCVIMGAALAKAGIPGPLREFILWYAEFQREDGFVPCVVDRDGIDWLVEHDSHGQFLWGIREVFRNDGKRAFLKRMLPHAAKAADYLISLRRERMTDAYRTPERSVCFGLLPESASHEGYLAHPVHSYWDDFWGVRGLEAAADLAEAAGKPKDAARWRSEAADFQKDLVDSMSAVIRDKNLSYLPGSVEWADFDPTATSNGIAMLDFAGALPQQPLREMLATYLDGFRRKHGGQMPWNNYTAYEIRIISAFVRLGERATANELLEFFLSDRRPCEWNQWPEITWKDPRSPGHLGDVPHTWIAAEYLLSLVSMVAAEREADASVVLASGMPWSWISEGDGFSVGKLPMHSGSLDFRIQSDGSDRIRVQVGGKFALPQGGLFIEPPLPDGMRIVAVEADTASLAEIASGGHRVRVNSLPFSAQLRIG